MPDTESDHHSGDAAVARLNLVTPPAPAAPATTSSSSCATGTATARDEDEEEDGFTFAAVAVPRLQAADCALQDARIGGPVYPLFGRPRWSPPKQQHQQEEEGPAGTGTPTVRRVPLGRLLLEDRCCDCDCAPSASGQQPADDADTDAELDGVPADTYCLWSPGISPPAPAGSSRRASPARCRKSGSTGSSVVLRWRRQRRRSHSDGKDDRFVFLGTSSDRIGTGEGHGRLMNRGSATWGGGSKSTTTSFLPCKQDLVGLVVSAVTFRRSYLPF